MPQGPGIELLCEIRPEHTDEARGKTILRDHDRACRGGQRPDGVGRGHVLCQIKVVDPVCMRDLGYPQDEMIGQADNDCVSTSTETCQLTRVGDVGTNKFDICRDGWLFVRVHPYDLHPQLAQQERNQIAHTAHTNHERFSNSHNASSSSAPSLLYSPL